MNDTPFMSRDPSLSERKAGGGLAWQIWKYYMERGLIYEKQPGIWVGVPMTPQEKRQQKEWFRRKGFRQVAPGVQTPLSPEFFLMWAVLAWDRLVANAHRLLGR